MDRKSKKEVYENIRKALYMIDMNNGFVNFGNMANPKYNELVNEQLKLINKFRKENQLVNFVLEGHTTDSIEFDSYPSHCVLGTKEAELIPEFINEQNKENTRTYYKNSINGMLNRNLQDDIKNQDNLNEIVIGGVCADLCVMDFARTFSSADALFCHLSSRSRLRRLLGGSFTLSSSFSCSGGRAGS